MSPAASRPRCRRISRNRISAAVALLALALVAPAGAAIDGRAAARAAGGDRATALRVAGDLLAQPLPVQLTKIRCERFADQRFCGLTLSGVKFHRRIDRQAFENEVDTLIARTFAADPQIVEVDLWTTVPADAGKGATVSGDFALPTSATVFATTARRGEATPSRGGNAFWDPTFRRELDQGTAE